MRTTKPFGILALIAIIAALAFTACPQDDNDPDPTPTPTPETPGTETGITSIDESEELLASKSANTPDTAYTLKLKVNDLTGLKDILWAEPDKYVYLDLSDSSITDIPDSAFYDTSSYKGCATLTGITIPNSVTSIGNAAFVECANLTSVIIGNKVTIIGNGAFDSTGLTSVTIPDSVSSIGNSAFFNCTSLTSVTIGSGVTSIEGYAFCFTNITNIIIPSSVISIGYNAFSCLSLTSVTFQGTIASSNFDDVANNDVFLGDLRDKFYASNPTNGTPGTYIRSGDYPNFTWTKQ